MFYVYILKSKRDGRLYVGSTNNLKKRVEEHNSKKNFSTKYRTPFELRYYEAYSVEEEARFREKQLKRYSKAWAQLKRRVLKSLK